MNGNLVLRPQYRIIDYILVLIFVIFIWNAIVSYSQVVISLFLIIGLFGYMKLLWDELYYVFIDEETIIFQQNFIMKRKQLINKSTIKKLIIAKSSIPGPNELIVELEGNKSTFTFFGGDKSISRIINFFLINGIKVDRSTKLNYPRGV